MTTNVRMDRKGRVVKVLRREGRKAASSWSSQAIDRYRAGLIDLEDLAWAIGRELGEKGGEGSGHFGHAGRPGKVGGSAPAGEYGSLNKNQRRAARKGIQAVLAHGLKTGNEAMVLIDSEGNRIDGMPTGTPWGVGVDPDLAESAEILIHNHPPSTPFSAPDVAQLFVLPNLKHMLVIGHDGTLYRLSAPDDIEKWPSFARRRMYNTLAEAWNKEVDEEDDFYHSLMDSRTLTHETINILTYHRAMADFAKSLGLEYTMVAPSAEGTQLREWWVKAPRDRRILR